MGGEIERDQFLLPQRFVIEANEAAVSPGDEIVFEKGSEKGRLLDFGRGVSRPGELALIKRVVFARTLSFERVSLSLKR